MNRRITRALAAAAVAPAPRPAPRAAERRGATGSGSAGGQIDYWLWDANQQPAYQKCADAFAAANPGITVKIDPVRLGRLLDRP